jgi:hypothetical protein
MRSVFATLVCTIALGSAATGAGAQTGLRPQADGKFSELSGEHWQARLNVLSTPLRPSLNGSVPPPAWRLFGDYYFGSAMPGRAPQGFRATGGVFGGARSGGLQVSSLSPLSRPGVGLAVPLPEALGADAGPALPYVGIGYTGSAYGGSWRFTADLGLLASPSGPGLRAVRGPGGAQNLDDTVRDLRLQPTLQLGASYAF